MAETTNCRSCGEEIAFEKNKNDRWAPVDPMSRQPHRCQTERTCESCEKTFKGASWMKVCGDCYRNGGKAQDPAPAAPSSSQPREELDLGHPGLDDDAPPF